MSHFHRRVRHPETGEFEDAVWLDDYFGRHRYGVRFPDGLIYPAHGREWEFEPVVEQGHGPCNVGTVSS